MAYQIIRTPHLSKAAFEAVPAEAVGLVSISLGQASPGSERSDSARRAIKQLTGLDIGREIFSNIEQVTLFAIPPTEAILQNNLSKKEGPIPFCFGLAVTSRNPHQTRELLDRLLSIPEIIFSSASSPEESGQGHQGDQLQSKYLITDDKYYCHVAQVGRTNVLAMDSAVLQTSMTAAKSGDNALKAGPLQLALSQMAPGTGKLVTVNAGGALQLALAQMEWENNLGRTVQAEQIQIISKLSEVFADTNVQLRTVESPNSLTLRVGLDNLPPLAEVFPLVMQLDRKKTRVSLSAKAERTPKASSSPDFTKLPKGKGLALKVVEKSKWRPTAWLGAHMKVSRNYSTEVKDAAMRFTTNDSDALKVWIRYFDRPVDYRAYPILVLRYRGSNLSEQGMYNIWMDDGRGPSIGGFVAVGIAELVGDGKVHEIRKDLRELNVRGPIRMGGVVVQNLIHEPSESPVVLLGGEGLWDCRAWAA